MATTFVVLPFFFKGVFSCLPRGNEDDDVPVVTPFPRSGTEETNGNIVPFP
jgi:hypothetical protein